MPYGGNTVDILLATYNSSNFLNETIESILKQDFSDWRLLVRDDGSKDETIEIIQNFARRYPEKILLIPSEQRHGACINFAKLLSVSTAPFVMFCDHDDVWLSDKISKFFNCIKKQEKKYGTDTPLLVFTDMRVVDKKLHLISDSYFKYQHLDPSKTEFNRLLVQNVPSGCTMMINRALADICGNIPPQAVMHDHWISLTAAAFGRLIYLNEKTILYRQHNDNVFGASQYNTKYFIRLYKKGKSKIKERFNQNILQAKAFYDCYKNLLNPEKKELLIKFMSLPEMSWFARRKILFHYKILKTGFGRNLGMFLIT